LTNRTFAKTEPLQITEFPHNEDVYFRGLLMFTALRMITDAFHDIFDNVGAAIRIALVPMIIVAIAGTFETLGLQGDASARLSANAASIVKMVMGAVISIGWIRFIILGHAPKAGFFTWHGSFLWSYIWRYFVMNLGGATIVMVLIMLGMALSFAVFDSFSEGIMPFLMQLSVTTTGSLWAIGIGLGLVWVINWFTMRTCLWLVRVCIETLDTASRSSWNRTKSVAGPVIWIAAFFAIMEIVKTSAIDIARLTFGLSEPSAVLNIAITIAFATMASFLLLLVSAVFARIYIETNDTNIADTFG
jgi:hypothetical protein